VKVWVDRFDTGLVDLDGTGGLFAQVNGRTSDAVIAWLKERDPAWLAGISNGRTEGIQPHRQTHRPDRVRLSEH
jgi:hypothetical protein